jgi:hypothetical protein
MKFLAIFLFSSVLFAQQPVPQALQIPKPVEIKILPITVEMQVKIDKIDKKAGDQKMRLQAIMWKWQQKLKLTDYMIGMDVASLEELPLGAVGASGLLIPEHKFAVIEVLDAGEYMRIDGVWAAAGLKVELGNKPTPTKLKAILTDQENTVIHELIHMSMNNKTPREEERHVAVIADLLQKGKVK